MPDEISSAKLELVNALTELQTALTTRSRNREQVSVAAVALVELVNGFPASLRQHLAPMDVMGSLLDFVNININIAYAANGPQHIPATALPPPASWLKKLGQFIEDFGGKTTDDSAWVLISKLEPPRIPNVKERKRYIDKHPEIRSRPQKIKAGTDHPRRTEVHVGDWVKHWSKMNPQTFDNLDSGNPKPITPDELADEDRAEDFVIGATRLYSDIFQGKKPRP
jgi:hypothetical protein